MTEIAATSDKRESKPENYKSLTISLAIALCLFIVFAVMLLRHWNYTLMAKPANQKQVETKQVFAPDVVVQQPVANQQPMIVQPQQASHQPAAPLPGEFDGMDEDRQESLVYVNIIVVDHNSGTLQFPVFEKVPLSTIIRNEKMTEFTFEGKRNIFFCRVLESVPYTDDDVPQIGTISYPDKCNPGKMIVVRCNQSEQDVYRDGFGMYYKTKSSGILPAPEQANWFTRPVSPTQ
jgi:hypothetical protein